MWSIITCPRIRKIMFTVLAAPDVPAPMAYLSVLPAKTSHFCYLPSKNSLTASCVIFVRKKIGSRFLPLRQKNHLDPAAAPLIPILAIPLAKKVKLRVCLSRDKFCILSRHYRLITVKPAYTSHGHNLCFFAGSLAPIAVLLKLANRLLRAFASPAQCSSLTKNSASYLSVRGITFEFFGKRKPLFFRIRSANMYTSAIPGEQNMALSGCFQRI